MPEINQKDTKYAILLTLTFPEAPEIAGKSECTLHIYARKRLFMHDSGLVCALYTDRLLAISLPIASDKQIDCLRSPDRSLTVSKSGRSGVHFCGKNRAETPPFSSLSTVNIFLSHYGCAIYRFLLRFFPSACVMGRNTRFSRRLECKVSELTCCCLWQADLHPYRRYAGMHLREN